MKNLLLGVIAVVLSLGVADVHAKNYYVGGALGAIVTNDSDYSETDLNDATIEMNATLGLAVAAGVKLTNNIRTEFEISYRNTDLDEISTSTGSGKLGGDFSTWGFMVNGYYDFMPKALINPYVVGGVGVLHHTIDVNSVAGLSVTGVDASDMTFGYQAGLGVTSPIAKAWTLDLGYRFLGGSDADLKGAEASYGSHDFRVGVRYDF